MQRPVPWALASHRAANRSSLAPLTFLTISIDLAPPRQGACRERWWVHESLARRRAGRPGPCIESFPWLLSSGTEACRKSSRSRASSAEPAVQVARGRVSARAGASCFRQGQHCLHEGLWLTPAAKRLLSPKLSLPRSDALGLDTPVHSAEQNGTCQQRRREATCSGARPCSPETRLPQTAHSHRASLRSPTQRHCPGPQRRGGGWSSTVANPPVNPASARLLAGDEPRGLAGQDARPRGSPASARDCCGSRQQSHVPTARLLQWERAGTHVTAALGTSSDQLHHAASGSLSGFVSKECTFGCLLSNRCGPEAPQKSARFSKSPAGKA